MTTVAATPNTGMVVVPPDTSVGAGAGVGAGVGATCASVTSIIVAKTMSTAAKSCFLPAPSIFTLSSSALLLFLFIFFLSEDWSDGRSLAQFELGRTAGIYRKIVKGFC
jgi:hypothetical protein